MGKAFGENGSVAKPINADLRNGFALPQLAEKHGWFAPMPIGLNKAKIILEGN